MAHPSRKAMVEDLNNNLLDRKLEPVWDRHNDRHETGLRCLQAYDQEATHHLILQDDTLPCSHLVEGIENALNFVDEGSPLVGYLGAVPPFSRNVERLVRRHRSGWTSWITMSGVYWGPCLVIPTSAMPDLIEFYTNATITNYDRRVSRYFESVGVNAWYPWPSLVDHRHSPSIAHPQAVGRRGALRFVQQDARDINWSGQVLHLPRTDKMDEQRQIEAAGPK